MKKLIFSLLLSLPIFAQAATLYYSRCDNTVDVNSHASCVAGLDTNDGLSASTPKLTPPTSFTTGNVYRFNRAGAWDSFARVLISSRQDIVFESYTPASCTGDCLDRKAQLGASITLTSNTCPNNLFWLTGDAARITIRDLHMIGKANDDTVYPVPPATTSRCGTHRAVYIIGSTANGNSGHVIENNTMERHVIAIGLAASDAVADTANRNVSIRNNLIKWSVAQGILGGANGLLIEGNTFDGSAWIHEVPGISVKDGHHLYLSSSGTGTASPARWMVVRGNTFLRHNWKPGTPSSTCSTTILVGHGDMPDLTIENNYIYEENADGDCYAMVIDGNTSSGDEAQRYPRLRMRGNIVSVPNAFVLLGCSSCPDAIIENNVLVSPGSTSSVQAIVITTLSSSANYKPDTRGDSAPGIVTIRNNSIYVDSTAGTARGSCIAYRYTEYSVPTPSVEDVIVNNVCVYGPNHPTSARAFGLEGAGPSRFAAFSNNYVWKSGGTPVWSDAYSTLAAFNTAFGVKSANNSQADPVITTPTLGNLWNMAPTVGSPLIDAGHSTRSSRTDVDRYIPAGVRRDIGAREYNRTTQAPVGPTGARIQ